MTVHPEQFRLSRIQLVNWGTVDGYLDIDVPREGFLITGASGSGKSTIIDAVAAVLIPPEKLNFNAAGQSGGTGNRSAGRSLVSYIRGAWRRGEDPHSGDITSTYLRNGATWSALALTYTTGDCDGEGTAEKHITLTAFYYLKSGETSRAAVKRLYGVHQEQVDLDPLSMRSMSSSWSATGADVASRA